MEEEFQIALQAFEQLQATDIYTLHEKNMVLERQLAKLQESRLQSLLEAERVTISLSVSEQKLSSRDLRVQQLEEQLA